MRAILQKHNGLSLATKTRMGYPPDQATIKEIADAVLPGNLQHQRPLIRGLCEEVNAGKLKALYTPRPLPLDLTPRYNAIPYSIQDVNGAQRILTDGYSVPQWALFIVIARDDFRSWLQAQGEPMPEWWSSPKGCGIVRARKPIERENDKTLLIDTAITEMEGINEATPSFPELWAHLVTGKFIHPLLIEHDRNRLKLSGGAHLTKQGAKRIYDRRFK